MHAPAGVSTFTVLPQGYPHSRTICHGLADQCLDNSNTLLHFKLLSYVDDNIHIEGRTVRLIEEVVEALSNTTETIQNHGWEINPKKMQKPATEVKFGMIIWQELCRMVCLAD